MRYIKYARHHGEVVRIISAPEYVKYISMYVEVHDNAKDAGATVPRHTLATIDGIHFLISTIVKASFHGLYVL